MNDRTKLLLVKRFLGKSTSADYVEWAIGCLEDGLNSKSLGILAASEKSDFPSEIEERFKRALRELQIQMPESRELLLWYARSVARRILSGEIGEAQGCAEIYGIWTKVIYDPDLDIDLTELTRWVYLDEGMDPDTYEWLSDPSTYPTIESPRWFEAIRKEATRLVSLDC